VTVSAGDYLFPFPPTDFESDRRIMGEQLDDFEPRRGNSFN
jgi:hypothetical protein